jgi:hypothetical protein
MVTPSHSRNLGPNKRDSTTRLQSALIETSHHSDLGPIHITPFHFIRTRSAAHTMSDIIRATSLAFDNILSTNINIKPHSRAAFTIPYGVGISAEFHSYLVSLLIPSCIGLDIVANCILSWGAVSSSYPRSRLLPLRYSFGSRKTDKVSR